MERIGFRLKVKKEKLEEYKKHHAAVWPELLDAIRKHGMRNYSIFTTDDGQLFGYAECDVNLETSLAGLDSERGHKLPLLRQNHIFGHSEPPK